MNGKRSLILKITTVLPEPFGKLRRALSKGTFGVSQEDYHEKPRNRQAIEPCAIISLR